MLFTLHKNKKGDREKYNVNCAEKSIDLQCQFSFSVCRSWLACYVFQAFFQFQCLWYFTPGNPLQVVLTNISRKLKKKIECAESGMALADQNVNPTSISKQLNIQTYGRPRQYVSNLAHQYQQLVNYFALLSTHYSYQEENLQIQPRIFFLFCAMNMVYPAAIPSTEHYITFYN